MADRIETLTLEGVITAQVLEVERFKDGPGAMLVFLTDSYDKVKVFCAGDVLNGQNDGDRVSMRLGFTRKGGLRVKEFVATPAAAAAPAAPKAGA